MPHRPPVTEIRITNIIVCLTPAIAMLNDLSDAFGTPFLLAISSTTQSLITAVQNAKKNKNECIMLVENIHEMLYAIVNLHIKSEPEGSLNPESLQHIGKFTETLNKIHTFVEAQQEGNKITQFFRHSERTTLLKDCRAGLKKAAEVFKIETGSTVVGNINEMQRRSEKIHKELLELISTLSDATTSDRSSSVHLWDSTLNSSNSLSLLPAQPKIFHGRETELKDLVAILHNETARIAILGAGGMGKTSLAKATLYHPDIVTKYQSRFFVATDSATSSIELAALIGTHIGLKPGKDLTKPVVHYFSSGPACLLILDNLETVWEPLESRSKVEEFLSVLTDIKHLALVITMRGAERPARVSWTHPFLPPLKPLPYDAARQTFIDIAEDFHEDQHVADLLSFTDNMPLAVDLMAHLVDYEGCSNVLARWETEKTSMLSDGFDRRSNLDASINISLSSPRMSPGARDLLSLLSILPDGLSDVELLQSQLPIIDILGCKSVLLRTALAYNDDKKRLKSLVPIREHMQHFHPASQSLIPHLQNHFHSLLDLYHKHSGTQQVAGGLKQLASNLGNIHQVLLQGLHSDNLNLVDTMYCVVGLNRFTRTTGRGRHVLMDHISAVLSSICDARLAAAFITEEFNSCPYHPVGNPTQLIAEAISHFSKFSDPGLESNFYGTVGNYYFHYQKNISASMPFLDKALTLSRSPGAGKMGAAVLNNLAIIKWTMGDYPAAQTHAHEAQVLAQLSADFYIGAYALRTEAMCCGALGDYRNGISLCHKARNLLELCGMSGGAVDNNIMTTQAELHLLKSEYVEARRIHTQIIQRTAADQDAHIHVFGLINIAEIDIIIGASEPDVHQNLTKGRVLFNALGYPHGLSFCERLLADLNLREGQFITAKSQFQKCLNLTGKNNVQDTLKCLERLADVSRWTVGDFDWASRSTFMYLGYAQKLQNKLALHKALLFLGDVFSSAGDEYTAHSLFVVALEGFTYMDVHQSRAQCMIRLGDIEKQRGDLQKAVTFWEEARPLFERSSQAKEIIQIDTRLAAAYPVILNAQTKRLAQLRDLVVPTMALEAPYIDTITDTPKIENNNEVEDLKGQAVTSVAL